MTDQRLIRQIESLLRLYIRRGLLPPGIKNPVLGGIGIAFGAEPQPAPPPPVIYLESGMVRSDAVLGAQLLISAITQARIAAAESVGAPYLENGIEGDSISLPDITEAYKAPASLWTGRLRWFVQCMYGAGRTFSVPDTGGYPELSVAGITLKCAWPTTHGLYTDGDYNYWLLEVTTTSLSVKPLIPSAVGDGLRIWLMNNRALLAQDVVDFLEGGILSTCTASSDPWTQILSYDVTAFGSPLAYGWKFNRDGSEASVTVLVQDPATAWGDINHRWLTRTLTLSINYNGTTWSSGIINDGPFALQCQKTVVNFWQPVYFTGMQSRWISYDENNPPDFVACNAPVYSYYDANDQVVTITYRDSGQSGEIVDAIGDFPTNDCDKEFGVCYKRINGGNDASYTARIIGLGSRLIEMATFPTTESFQFGTSGGVTEELWAHENTVIDACGNVPSTPAECNQNGYWVRQRRQDMYRDYYRQDSAYINDGHLALVLPFFDAAAAYVADYHQSNTRLTWTHLEGSQVRLECDATIYCINVAHPDGEPAGIELSTLITDIPQAWSAYTPSWTQTDGVSGVNLSLDLEVLLYSARGSETIWKSEGGYTNSSPTGGCLDHIVAIGGSGTVDYNGWLSFLSPQVDIYDPLQVVVSSESNAVRAREGIGSFTLFVDPIDYDVAESGVFVGNE